MPRFRVNLARLIALLALLAGLLGPAAPGLAAAVAAGPQPLHAMDCDDGGKPAPIHHAPGAVDCCAAVICAMNLALPAVSGIAPPFAPAALQYDLRTLLHPLGVDLEPIPHPPKPTA